MKYQINIQSIPNDIIPMLKPLRVIGNLDLKSANDLAEYLMKYCPCILVAGIDKKTADHVMNLLQAAKIKAEIAESSISHPMFLHPDSERCYFWHGFKGVVPIPSEGR
ncbi:MAG TPA: hypothetical protein VHR47_03260 [Bacillota bacterium]|nr:hypothetical protein [Bacillota bacterium]